MKRFRPPPWAWLVLLPLLGMLVALGNWQLRRAHEKEALQAAYESAAKREPVELRAKELASSELPVPVRAFGSYLESRQLLLDNQSHDGRPGYHVWTPMRLRTGGLIIVDRGWIERAATGALPSPGGMIEVSGLWRSLPRPGMRLAAAPLQPISQFPAAVEYPTAGDLHTLLGEPVVDGVLLLDPSQAEGFVRVWNPVAALPPSRHYGYAVQWFALSIALVVLFVIVNRKPA